MSYERQFHVGKTYLTQEGKRVKIIAESTVPGMRGACVQGDDGVTRVEEHWKHKGIYEIIEGSTAGWRYDREGDVGRVTGSPHDFSDVRNLVAGSEQPE
jgi:hypothetical protein